MDRSDSDDLFNQLAGKHAHQEFEAVNSDPVTEAKKNHVNQLFEMIKDRGSKFEDHDLSLWKHVSDMRVSSCMVLFAAFLKGIPLPLVDDPEISTEPLGDLGACLMAGSKLFGFYDAATGIVHIPSGRGLDNDWENRIDDCTSFLVSYNNIMPAAHKWEGCHTSLGAEEHDDGQPVLVEFEGEWCGPTPKNMGEVLIRKMFSNVKIQYGTARLAQIEFEREMRKAFGKT